MKLTPSSSLVKRSLSAHSWIGLVIGALMYVVCLTGTLAVFYQEFERWEQPYAEQLDTYDPAVIEDAYRTVAARVPELTEHMYVTLPTPSLPHAAVASEEQGWFVKADGSIGGPVAHDWTHLLLNLHIYLHLPETIGIVLVGSLGAMLLGLIISGFLAHPRIFKDAFTLRLNGSRHLEQADIHNRLSVWGAPFHLIIAATGAFFAGLYLVLFVFGTALFDGDQSAAMAAVYGDDPVVPAGEGQPRVPDISGALVELESMAPNVVPMSLTVHDAGTVNQSIEVFARHPGRLLWSENYSFDSSGTFLGTDGFSDGALGKQVVYSVYRLHFGHFGGFAVKIVYGLLGLALTIVSVTGVNVWLARRRMRNYLNDAWTGIVWGVPAALTLSAVLEVVFNIPATWLFWAASIAAIVMALKYKDEQKSKRVLQTACAVLLCVLVAGHAARFQHDAFSGAAAAMNGAMLVGVLLMTAMARGRRRRTFDRRLSDART